MKKNNIYSVALFLTAALVFGGCGTSSSSDAAKADPLELESDGKTIFFYSASTSKQYAFNVDSQSITNLNNELDADDNNISNFNMDSSKNGKLFVWVDDKGDTNSSNDEGKVVMFKQSYSYANDGNVSWEDFYYLGHFHEERTGYHLAAHSNSEFNVTSGAKFDAITRLNKYLASQNSLEQNLSNAIPSEANGLCAFHTFTNEANKTFYYAIGRNGTLHIYDANITTPALDSVAVAAGCEINKAGVSSTEDGVLLFFANTQKLYKVDSHEDGIYHIHNTWNLSQLLGEGKTAQMMVGLQPLIQE